MIESQSLGKIHIVVEPDIGCVGSGAGLASGTGDPNHRRRVSTGIAFRVGIDVELTNEFDVESGFFFGFAQGSFFNSFTDIDKTSGKRPSVGAVLAFNEDDESCAQLDNEVGAQTQCLGSSLI